MTDMVNHPPHYEGRIESIDAMEEVVGKSGVFDFCICNAFKYIWRCKKKHNSPIEDLKKAVWYLNHAIDIYEEPVVKEFYFDNQKVTVKED